MNDLMIKIDNVSKQYKLGQIGGTTLRDELQRVRAKRKGLEDPTKKIGSKDYNKGETFMALDGVSFEVKKCERVGIIGHNGAGKSTLLKLISRVTAPTGGTISMNGRVASMLEVGTGFHGELTGRENIYMNGAILGMTKKEIDAKIEDIIEFSECRQFIDTPVKRYSSGMYVKLAFSVAAHLDSEIMIMDEVLAVGDMAFQKKCLDKMNDVSRQGGRTILYVSHNMNTIRQLCERVIVLDHGKVVFDGEVEKGIGVYMGALRTAKKDYKYTLTERKFSTGNDPFVLSEFHVLNTEDVIDPGQRIQARVECVCKKNYTAVKFRFEFHFCDGSAIGTSFSDRPICMEEGHHTISLSLDTSAFPPGDYYADIIVYEYNDNGAQGLLDGVYPGFSFSINHTVNEWNQLQWLHACWGHIHLSSINVGEIR